METIVFPEHSAKNLQISPDLVTTYKAHAPLRLNVIAYNFHEVVENISISRYNLTISHIHIVPEYIWRITHGSN